jgi:hypothetical protein
MASREDELFPTFAMEDMLNHAEPHTDVGDDDHVILVHSPKYGQTTAMTQRLGLLYGSLKDHKNTILRLSVLT